CGFKFHGSVLPNWVGRLRGDRQSKSSSDSWPAPGFPSVVRSRLGLILTHPQNADLWLFLLVQIQICLARDECEDFANLLEAGTQKELRVSAIALGNEDVEVRLRIAQVIGSLCRNAEAIGTVKFEERRRELHRAHRGIALVHLQFAVQVVVRRIADIGDYA